MSGSVKLWKQAFARLDECPWPGPRPLREDDTELLIGRSDERRSFQRVIRENRLVLLHGSSGVGKSSLLRAGLIPDLERSGRTVYAADQWGGAQTGDLEVFLAERLQLPGTGSEAFGAVDRESVVLVLDQFEELIRYSPPQAAAAFDLIVRLNRSAETKVVISFRSEYLHEFTDLEAEVVNFTTTQVRLEEVQPSAAENIVLAGRRRAESVVDEAAASAIATAWRSARTQSTADTVTADPFDRVGLLHLQAFLYALYFDSGRAVVTEGAVARALKSWGAVESDGSPKPRTTFREALQRAVNHKLDHCHGAATEVSGTEIGEIDRILVDGTHWAVVRTVSHLSSAGYKLIRQAGELAKLVLGPDMYALVDGLTASAGAPDRRQVPALFDAVLAASGLGAGDDNNNNDEAGGDNVKLPDLLAIDRASVAKEADKSLGDGHANVPWTERLVTERSTLIADQVGVTAGPMMGRTAAEVLIEEFRRIVLGLVWLEESALIRATTLPGAGTMISLIHDGFGSALVRWAEAHDGAPAGPLSAITAPRGASFPWRDGAARPGQVRSADIGGEGEHLVLPNVVWRGAWIQADLERVAFVNCDFRGLLFDGCRLAGVNFVNCMLDGAIFSDCVVSGLLNIHESDVWSDDEPTFVIDAPAGLVAAHASYRDIPHPENGFLSPLPGAAAIPWQGGPGTERLHRPDSEDTEFGRLDAPLAPGGVVIHGGRVSNLVVRGCHIEDGSGWYLRHTVGSGLDFVELLPQKFRLVVYGSALRHLSFSPILGGDPAVVDVDAEGSVLSEVWVAPQIRGTIDARDTTVVHAWNGSPSADDKRGVEFTVDKRSRYHGLIDVTVGKDATALGPGEQSIAFERLDHPVLREQQSRMDYRRNPAVTTESVTEAASTPD